MEVGDSNIKRDKNEKPNIPHCRNNPNLNHISRFNNFLIVCLQEAMNNITIGFCRCLLFSVLEFEICQRSGSHCLPLLCVELIVFPGNGSCSGWSIRLKKTAVILCCTPHTILQKTIRGHIEMNFLI